MASRNTPELSDPAVYPGEEVLKETLGKSFGAYRELLRLFDGNSMEYEWRYYKDGKAWLCKVQKKNKTIVWMSAWKGYLKAAIYIPEKHIEDVYKLDLGDEVIDRITATNNTGRSKPCIFEIKNRKILKDFNTVMQFKLACR